VTGVKVITENFLPEFRKMLPKVEVREQHFANQGQKNFQWWLTMPVTICFVIPQNQNKKFKQKLF